MLTREDVEQNFSHVSDLDGGVLKFRDVMPRYTYHYYLRIAPTIGSGEDLLAVSENIERDEFGMFLLEQAAKTPRAAPLDRRDLAQNEFRFSSMLLADSDYHAYFKGRLDAQRQTLTLCLPVHECEFSGDESIDEFFAMRRDFVSTLDWGRKPTPKIRLRFANPDTKGGTKNGSVLAKYSTVLREMDSLQGVGSGFLELENYRKQILEVLSPDETSYVVIRDRNDATRRTFPRDEAKDVVWAFLTGQ